MFSGVHPSQLWVCLLQNRWPSLWEKTPKSEGTHTKKKPIYFTSGISYSSMGLLREGISRHLFLAKTLYMDFGGKGMGQKNRKRNWRVRGYYVFLFQFPILGNEDAKPESCHGDHKFLISERRPISWKS